MNSHAYDELKKRLLNEYKKLCTNKKSFDDQVRERYKSMKERQGSSGNTNKKQNTSQIEKISKKN